MGDINMQFLSPYIPYAYPSIPSSIPSTKSPTSFPQTPTLSHTALPPSTYYTYSTPISSPHPQTPTTSPSTPTIITHNPQTIASMQQQLLLQQYYLTLASSPLLQQQLLLQNAAFLSQWGNTGVNTQTPYVFKAHSMPQNNRDTTTTVTREQRLQAYRKKRSKRAQRPVDSNKSTLAQARPRDENGQFLPGKIPKPSDLADLKCRLDHREQECNKLRNSLSERDRELENIKHQMQELMRQNEEQQERLYGMEQRQHRYDIHTIREFKQRLQNLQQLEMAVHERMSRNSINLTHDNINTQDTNQNEHTQPQIILDNLETSPNSDKSKDDQGDLDSQKPRKIIDVGAYYIYDPSWKDNFIAPPFREKIDFSKISLKPYGPPNYVEQARTECYEAQKKWELQQIEVTNMNQTYPNNYIYSNSPCTPAFTEKIDLKDQISKLRKTPISSYLSQTTQQYIMMNPIQPMDENQNMFNTEESPLDQILENQDM